MSLDTEKYYIPKKLDEPERIIFFSGDEFGVMVFPFIVLFFVFDSFMLGILFGALSLYAWKKFKGSEQANLHIYAMYWFYPSCLNNLKSTPSSYIRKYYG